MPRSPLSTDEHGRRYDRVSIQRAVDKQPGVQPIDATDSAAVAAELLADGKVLGLFQGGSELGPRALGNRSILFDARRADGQEYLNTRIKGREAFRPFAPVCLLEEVESWFESGHSHLVSPFMLRVVSVKPDKRHIIPAVTHVDGSARLQTVTPANGVLYEIVHRFWRRTGVPVLLNTSFNVNAEPLVETPDDALLCMLHANIDACLLGDLLVEKADAASTLLDLTPQYTGTGITLKVDHPGVIAASAGSRLVVTTATEWGPSTALVGGSTLAVLQLVDGRKTGKDIARILGEQKGVTEQHVNSELVSLVRRRVLRFAAPACPPVDVATAVAG